MRTRLPLPQYIDRLEAMYGPPAPPPVTDPFEMVVWECAAYLVDDERRAETFAALKEQVGMTPAALLKAPASTLLKAIREGGMLAPKRVEKVRAAAEIAAEVGLAELRKLVREQPKEARKVLKRFPGVGEPGADKILFFNRSVASLAPDSNALRVLQRLGYAEEHDDYGKAYRSAAKAVEPELNRDFDGLLSAHQLLRQHGQELCKRTTAACEACGLSKNCRAVHG